MLFRQMFPTFGLGFFDKYQYYENIVMTVALLIIALFARKPPVYYLVYRKHQYVYSTRTINL